MSARFPFEFSMRSLPSRERGLKSYIPYHRVKHICVAPFAGAWIEIEDDNITKEDYWKVAPFAGAWIEISRGRTPGQSSLCRSLRGSVD